MSNAVTFRYDFVYFFDIVDGNPNGDPDAGNLPRIDPETGQGLVTDVCLKRKIRNYVGLAYGDHSPYEIYVKEKAILNKQHQRAHDAWAAKQPKEEAKIDKNRETKSRATKDKGDDTRDQQEKKDRELTIWMCENFFDIRTFGAVMTTDVNCGQVRGPVQFGFARSIHRIVNAEFSVTRCAVTTQAESDKQDGGNRTMGRKFAVPYGLYRVHGYVNPKLAGGERGTGFSEDDLEVLKRALDQMFELDRSAARSNMKPVACIAFRHENPLGNARADKLFARVSCVPRPGVERLPQDKNEDTPDEGRPPRSFNDYDLTVNDSDLPLGVTIERWIDWS